MRYQEFPPAPSLAPIVKCFWILEDSAAPLEYAGPLDAVVPDGCPEIIVHYGDRFTEDAAGRGRIQPEVIVAQPSGRPPTEFVLTELGKTRAVFENPRHDSPQRITCELSAEGRLTASIGFTKGGTPRRFEFKREGN